MKMSKSGFLDNNSWLFNVIAIMVVILIPSLLDAQTPTYQSYIETPDNSGFYRIQIHTGSAGFIEPDMHDLRIINSRGKEVPRLAESDIERSATTNRFIEYTIVSHEIIKDSATILTLKNETRERINNLSLIIGNARVEKQIRLTGSNDGKVWYSVRENAVFGAVNNPNDISEIKLIDFPLSEYAFFRLEIDDHSSSPVNVIKAGTYQHTDNIVATEFTTISGNYKVADSIKQKTTWVDFSFNDLAAVDKIEIEISAPPFYHRQAEIYSYGRDSVNDRQRHFIMYSQMRSDDRIVIYLNDTRARGITFAIHNKDNPPLNITSIKAYQKNRFCIAWLEKGETYKMTFGDKAMPYPDYDIRFFKDKVNGTLPILKTSPKVLVTANNKQKGEKQTSIFTDSRFIWGAIVVVIMLLGYLTYSMMKEREE